MSATLIAQVLKKNGPMLSSELAKILETKHGMAAPAARKAVERGCEGVTKLSHLVFPHRARFVYMQATYGSERFFDRLLKALRDTNSTYYLALEALAMRSNAMPRRHFLIACGAPVAQQRHISAESVLERLLKAGLVKEVLLPDGSLCVVRCDRESDFLDSHDLREMSARLIAERVALLAVRDWARNLGIVSYNAVKTREDEPLDVVPKVGTFEWDMAGPSYLFPMRTYPAGSAVKPGFFVCDITLNGRVSVDEISAFVKKCTTLRSLPKVGRCLQIFVAQEYTGEAFHLLKSEGIIPATTDSLFGTEVAKALKSLCKVLIDTAALLKSPEKLETIFNTLSRIEGAAATLRGSLFEFAVAQIVKTTFPGCEIEVNRRVKDGLGRAAEIDVLAYRKNKDVVFIECKGTHPLGNVDNEEVRKWLDDRIPVLRDVAKHHSEWSNLHQHFEIWTSGQFTPEAISMIEERMQQTSRYTLGYRAARDVESEVHSSGDAGLLRTYEQHFIKNPLLEDQKAQERAVRKQDRDKQRQVEQGTTQPPAPSFAAIPAQL